MAEAYRFELVSPERLLVSTDVESVVIPGAEGEMTVMANHSPVMTTIRPGVVTVKRDNGDVQRFAVFGGFADILPTGCTLLAESAYPVPGFSADVLDKRIAMARADVQGAQNDEARVRSSQLMADLESLASVTG